MTNGRERQPPIPVPQPPEAQESAVHPTNLRTVSFSSGREGHLHETMDWWWPGAGETAGGQLHVDSHQVSVKQDE